MSASIWPERELTPFEQQIQKRRVVKAIATDLVASSRRMETPAGLVTLVDIKFLRELADVVQVTGEHLYAVVDETHLARVAQAAGLIDRVPPPTSLPGDPLVVDPADIRAAIKWKGWTNVQAAMELGIGKSSLDFYLPGVRPPRGEIRKQLHALIQEMRAALEQVGNA